MKIGAIVICRYNSSRLPGKILKEINGKALIEYILERLKKVEGVDEIVIATSIQETDDPIEEYCKTNNLECYRGDLNNVAKRFMDCTNRYNFDYAIRVNGDNLFLDNRIMSEMIDITRNGDYDLVTNVKDRTFPKGISVEIVKKSFYNKAYKEFSTDYYKEHVTIYFYDNENYGNYYYYKNTTNKEAAGVQLAIDTQEDFELAEKIIQSFEEPHTSYGFEEIYSRMKTVKQHN